LLDPEGVLEGGSGLVPSDGQPSPCFFPIGVSEEVIPTWLLDLMLQGQFRVAFIDEPMGDREYPAIGQKLGSCSCRPDSVDHPNPTNRGKAEGADFRDEVTAPNLELTRKGSRILRIQHLL
jgi:hypothetical protein